MADDLTLTEPPANERACGAPPDVVAPVESARRSAPGLPSGRSIALVLAAGLAVAWPFVAAPSMWFYGSLAVIYAMVALSLTILAGWTGQISLGHAAFLGFGVYAVRPLLEYGVPAPAAVLLSGVVAAAVSLVVGVPSLRLRGVYLAIVTLAFGMMCESFLFGLEAFSGGGIAHIIERPAGLDSDRVFYLVLLVPLALCLLLVNRLRNGDAGRVLFAIRDSEEAAQAMGVPLARYKIGVFALSAGITGLAGGFYGMLVGATPAGSQFGILQSWFFLGMPVIGGLESLIGALVGGMVLAFAQPLVELVGLRILLASGMLTIAVVLLRTGGLVGAVLRLRETFVRAAGLEPPVAASFLPEDPEHDADAPAVVRLSIEDAAAGEARLRLAVRRQAT